MNEGGAEASASASPEKGRCPSAHTGAERYYAGFGRGSVSRCGASAAHNRKEPPAARFLFAAKKKSGKEKPPKGTYSEAVPFGNPPRRPSSAQSASLGRRGGAIERTQVIAAPSQTAITQPARFATTRRFPPLDPPSGDGRRRTEDGRRRTEDGRRRTEDGGRKTEDGGRERTNGTGRDKHPWLPLWGCEAGARE